MKQDISSYNFIAKLKDLPFVDEIWLFGSRARGDCRDYSDIDLAILCPLAKGNDWLKVIDVIDNADTLLKIDCIRFDSALISNDLYKNILKERSVLYVKNNT